MATMQLAGPGVSGPPKDHDTAIAVLREAVASGVNAIDTSDFYGLPCDQPDHPRGAASLSRRPCDRHQDRPPGVGQDASWNPAMSADDLKSAVEDNLRESPPRGARGRQFADHGRGPRDPPKGPSRRRSQFWPTSSGRDWSVTSASAQRHRQSDRRRAQDL